MADYTADHARAGIQSKLPKLDTWPNQYAGSVITPRCPAYTSGCPKPGCRITAPSPSNICRAKSALSLKALKMYLLAYRDLGIFYENAVNKILHDIVDAVRPEWCVVRGEFTPRGGLTTSIFARWPERSPGRKAGGNVRAGRSKSR